jgi:hypothetical protein
VDLLAMQYPYQRKRCCESTQRQSVRGDIQMTNMQTKTMCDGLNAKAAETNPAFRFEVITMEVK